MFKLYTTFHFSAPQFRQQLFECLKNYFFLRFRA